MKKEKKTLTEGPLLRKKAEAKLRREQIVLSTAHTEVDILKLLHELEVHKIELEMQNQELQLAKEIAEASARQYGELFEEIFDFSPAGYFNIDNKSEILELNLSSARLLKQDRSSLIHKKFRSFIHPESIADFNNFIRVLFESGLKQRCEARLQFKDDSIIYVFLEGVVSKTEDKCLLTVIDISDRKLAEEHLKISEINARAIMESTSDIIILLDKDGIVIDNNEGHASRFGLSRKDLIGKSIFDFLPNEIAITRKKYIDEAVVENRPVTGEEFRAGRWTEFSIFPIQNTEKEVNRVAVFARDITEQKFVNETIRNSEEKFRKAFNMHPGVVGIVSLADSKYIDINNNFTVLLGWEREEIIGKTTLDIDLFTDLSQLDDITSMISKTGSVKNYLVNVKTKTGELRVGLFSAEIIEMEGQKSILLQVNDITDRAQTEVVLRASEEKFRLLFENMQQGAFYQLADGTLTDINPAGLEMFGLTRDQFLGKTSHHPDWKVVNLDLDHLEPENHPSMLALKSGNEVSKEVGIFNFQKKEYTWVTVSAKPQFKAGEESPYQVFVTMHDITERKRLEDAIEKRIISLTRPLSKDTEISFDELFNPADIQRIQDEFSAATGVASIITHPDGTPLTKPSSFTRFCSEIVRKTEKGCANCYNSDKALGAPHSGGPVIQTCLSGGLWDAGASIMVGDHHVANWLIGQVRDETQSVKAVKRYAKEIGVDEAELVNAFLEVPSMTQTQFKQVAQSLYTLANQLSDSAYYNIQQARFITDQKKVEEQLRASENKFRILFENSPVGKSMTGIDGTIHVNKAFSELLGYSEEELREKKWMEITHEEDISLTSSAINALLKGKSTSARFEKRYIHKSGKIVWVDLSTHLHLNEKGKPQYFITSLSDITERKRLESINASRLHLIQFSHNHTLDELLEEILNESEKLTDSLIGFIHFVEDDQETLRLQNWSRRTKAEFCKAEGRGMHYSLNEAGVWVDCVRQRKAVIHNDYASLPHRKGMPEGHALVIRELTVPIFRNEKIKVIVGVGNKAIDYSQQDIDTITLIGDLAWEIAERKQSEEALRESEERFRRLLRNVSSVSVQGYNPEGITQYWNQASEKLYGYAEEEAIGRNLLDLIIPPEMAESVKNAIRQMTETGEPLPSAELMLMHKSGARVSVFSSHAIVKMPGHEPELFCIDIDLSERKRAEEALQTSEQQLRELNATKDKFFSIIAHDLKSPLNNIVGFSSLLVEQVKDKGYSDILEYTDILKNASQHAMDLLVNLLEWSRLQTGSMPFMPEKVDVLQLINESIELSTGAALQKNISIVRDFPARIFAFVDRSMMGLILRNLISNAIKFTNTGGEIIVLARMPGTELLVSVHDNGVGISKNSLGKLFRIEESFSTKGTMNEKGTGLGLLLCKEFVNRHGGEIHVDSEVGKGSTFYFSIPLKGDF
ncbi:MAG: PAS domain S-box protein [Lentimicrobium sp.]|nr:PAS domain S-box protein [Lentimicrobium sp.]